MNINFALRSEILPQAILQHPVLFNNYYKLSVDILKCPAIEEYNKNKFIVPFPFDFYIRFIINEEKTEIKEASHDLNLIFKKILIVDKRSKNQMTLEIKPIQLIFWSDNSCLLESNGHVFDNTINLGGTLDIKKWIRPIHCSYVLDKNKEQIISYKKGDPWLYLKFHTEKKINLKYNFDSSIIQESVKMSESTKYVSGLKKYFQIFNKLRPRKMTK
tara:strand:- start:269 stop:916 length:648 start_codon:yes stop_codon:yes gene_type:complete